MTFQGHNPLKTLFCKINRNFTLQPLLLKCCNAQYDYICAYEIKHQNRPSLVMYRRRSSPAGWIHANFLTILYVHNSFRHCFKLCKYTFAKRHLRGNWHRWNGYLKVHIMCDSHAARTAFRIHILLALHRRCIQHCRNVFIAYCRPALEHCTPIWSSHLISDIARKCPEMLLPIAFRKTCRSPYQPNYITEQKFST